MEGPCILSYSLVGNEGMEGYSMLVLCLSNFIFV